MLNSSNDNQPLGRVIHWYDKIGVAVIKLDHPLRVGDRIKVKKGDDEFEDLVSSVQLDHRPIDNADAGAKVAIKLSKPTKEGALIFKID
jgi:putative protease